MQTAGDEDARRVARNDGNLGLVRKDKGGGIAELPALTTAVQGAYRAIRTDDHALAICIDQCHVTAVAPGGEGVAIAKIMDGLRLVADLGDRAVRERLGAIDRVDHLIGRVDHRVE